MVFMYYLHRGNGVFVGNVRNHDCWRERKPQVWITTFKQHFLGFQLNLAALNQYLFLYFASNTSISGFYIKKNILHLNNI